MTKPRLTNNPSATHAPEPESLDDLRQDCAHMSARWVTAETKQSKSTDKGGASLLHGVRVPEGSARLLDGMSDYGD